MSPTPRSTSAGDAKLSRLARASWLAQEKDKARALPTSDTADRESRHCREAREFFVAAQGQSRWLQPTQETLEAGVALPDPGEKKRGFNSKVNQGRTSASSQSTAPTSREKLEKWSVTEVLDLKERQEYLYCYLLPKENEHSETPEEEKQVCDQSEADWKEREKLTSIVLEQANSRSVDLTNFKRPIDLAQAISHVSLHDAMVMGSDHSNVTDAETTLERLEILPDLNTSPITRPTC
ncbi:uncharacterized protein LOC120307354 isoform X1 [Crotalus tigris]|uniref:uncharacterized protein LOC120307354 isoform X1 n=1 Tax=Crotalus tigris TaxID=88082 RepID=UPI00192FA367|nr:uncharacterized protein LOC120307354 isoform X1 [Crotalus tigris]